MKTRHVLVVTILILFSASILTNITPVQALQTTYSDVEWLDNTTFDGAAAEWTSSSSGDLTDVAASAGNGMANGTIIGEQDDYTVIADPPDSNWTDMANPSFPVIPNDGTGFDSEGFYASHDWDESSDQTGNTPSVDVKKNITMPVNMSDYEITSASVYAVVNASVNGNIDCPGDSDPGGSGGGSWIGDVHDYVRFSVLVSDLERVREYEVAYYETEYLGLNNGTSILTLADTTFFPDDLDLLKYYLTSVLSSDYQNFTITLRIFIYCEDNNDDTDRDIWTELRIKSFNLTISYQKKIDRFTTVAWNQMGNELPDPPTNGTLEVDSAILEFQYRIDQTWVAESPNSKIRILINDHPHSETIKLSEANSTFQAAKSGGYDVTSLISKGVNITVSIQVYIADNLELSTNRTISIDDVTLKITYTITVESEVPPGPNFLWLVIVLGIAIATILAAWAAYQFYLKYPRLIRIMRKMKKDIKAGKPMEPLDVNMRGQLVSDIYRDIIPDERLLQKYEAVKVVKGGK